MKWICYSQEIIPQQIFHWNNNVHRMSTNGSIVPRREQLRPFVNQELQSCDFSVQLYIGPDRGVVVSKSKIILESWIFNLCSFPSLSLFYWKSYLELKYYNLFPVVPQIYSVNVMDEHILRGNAAIVKCHIPTFVTDFVHVSAWILDDEIEIHAEHDSVDTSKPGII